MVSFSHKKLVELSNSNNIGLTDFKQKQKYQINTDMRYKRDNTRITTNKLGYDRTANRLCLLGH